MSEQRARSVLILGAASDIGRAVARRYAKDGCSLVLAARNAGRLEGDISDLRLRFSVNATALEFDILNTASYAPFLQSMGELPHTVVCVIGLLGEEREAETNLAAADLVMRTNYVCCALLLGQIAELMAARDEGCIIGISSVAGERGRASNYVYGSAKAGFTAFLSGLRSRLARTKVKVITIKPGFVRTRMTEGMDLPGLLIAEPEEVADAIVKAQRRGKDCVYVRPIWWLVMFVIRSIPEGLFKKMRF
jgi:decaprenylphospho-beta-D-erythro-pentofuranosid-2-ulose 2-reductase